jgi:hypothetical protein
VIKTINPNYVTSFEKAAQEEAAKRAEQQAQWAAGQPQRDREAKETARLLEERARQERTKAQMERSLQAKGYKFRSDGFGLTGCSYELQNCVWGCGALHDHLVIVFSDDSGKDFSVLHEFNVSPMMLSPILAFVDKQNGFLSYNVLGNGSRLYRTADGGTTWKQMLTTGKMGLMVPSVVRIVVNGRHILVEGDCSGSGWNIESNDDGQSWTSWIYVGSTKTHSDSSDGGLTWHTATEQAAETKRQRQLELQRQREAAEADNRERLEATRGRQAAEAERRRQATAEAERKRVEEARWRTWTSADGSYTVKARFVKAIGGTVYLLKKDGSTITVEREKLSEEDWEWITNQGWKK